MSFLRSLFGGSAKGTTPQASTGAKGESEADLLKWVAKTEAEDATEKLGVAPYPYERLAIIYRKRKDCRSEVAILERYFRHRQAPGVKPAKLKERLVKAKELLSQSEGR